MDKVSLARKFAKNKHQHQFRKDCKTPYFEHLKQVIERLKKLGISEEDILCAGWLHDTIEDTNTDYDDIYEKFGNKVADLVASVTKDTRLSEKERETKYNLQLKKASWEAKVIKLGDIVANIADLENSDYNKAKKIAQIKKKLLYFELIKPGIISHKTKLSGLQLVEEELNKLLVFYGQKKITFR